MKKMSRGVVIVLWLLVGCAAAPEVVDADVDDAEVEDRKLPPGIWDVEAGEQIDYDEFVGRLDESQFVVVGESHGTQWHHEVQRRVYEAMSDRRPGQVHLGLEMIERRFQPAVDDYVDGAIDEEEMLEQVEWEQRWGVDAEYYAPLWRQARRGEQRIVALNARRELVRSVGSVGLDGLSDDQRNELPEIDKSNDDYRQFLRQVFDAHGAHGDAEDFENFYEAQLVWDETMAETAWEFMVQRPSDEAMVILAGRFHVERGWGIPSRIVRRGASRDEVVTVIPVGVDGSRAGPSTHRDLTYLQDEDVADYVWIGP